MNHDDIIFYFFNMKIIDVGNLCVACACPSGIKNRNLAPAF